MVSNKEGTMALEYLTILRRVHTHTKHNGTSEHNDYAIILYYVSVVN